MLLPRLYAHEEVVESILPLETMLKPRESYYLRYIGAFGVVIVGMAGEIAKVSHT